MGEPVQIAVTIAAQTGDEWRTLAVLSPEDAEWLLSQCDVVDLREAFCRELRAALDRPDGGMARVSEPERDALRAVVREAGEAAPANVVQLGEQLADVYD
jgi:hypothetical protein